MNITLRKANALQNAIQDHIKTIEVKTSVSINEFQAPGGEMSRALDTVVSNDRRRADLTEALYKIRALVGKQNVYVGVSDHLARAAYVDKRIAQLKTLAESSVAENLDVINGKLDKIRNDKSDRGGFYGRQDSVETGVFTTAQIDGFKAEMQALKKEKQTINDKILELNIRTELNVDGDTAALLQREGLI